MSSPDPLGNSLPADIHPSPAELIALVRFHRDEMYLCVENDDDRWKCGMELARRYQGLLLEHGINPHRVNHEVFYDEIEAFFESGGCEAEIESFELVAQFAAAWCRVAIPEGYKLITYAFALVNADPWRPRIPAQFPNKRIREDAESLAAACAYIQQVNERNKTSDVGSYFYLPHRSAAKEMDRSKSYVGLLFRRLADAGVLKEVRPAARGEKGRATVYRYVGEPPSWPY